MPAITGFTVGEVLTSSNVNTYLLYGNENRIINGDFSINQRGFSSTTTTASYGLDRWYGQWSSGTTTYSAVAFNVGNTGLSGFEPTTHARLNTTGQTGAAGFARLEQRIEGVRTLAGQTVTVSFWAKAGSGTPKVAIELQQNFGTGGSASTQVNTYAGQVTLTTGWVRYSVSVTLPTLGLKTIGTDGNDFLNVAIYTSAGTDYNSRTNSLGLQNFEFNIWGVQVESGAIATPFISRPRQVELALCQRYYQKSYDYGTAPGSSIVATGAGGMWLPVCDQATGQYVAATNTYKVEMRPPNSSSYWDLAGNASKFSTYSAGAFARTDNVGALYSLIVGTGQLTAVAAPGAANMAAIAWAVGAEL